ncbi:MAG: sulfite exporter TauE/SafE family protein [Candidatus Cloacimonadota bacterium]|nr:sulfite exporter TauE/SafE family protein [Candidatus Cloacimonadota bacterium]
MLRILSQGFGLGIATGLTCLTTCSPIYIPFLLSEKRSLWNSSLKVFEISLGRFIAYLTFGALAGFTGSQLSSFNREIFTAISYISISLYLLFSAYRTHQHTKMCAIPKFTKFTQSAFLLGIVTGLNFCPSFLLAISNAISSGGAMNGSLLFLGFFFGTTIYLIPLIFVGGISKIHKMQHIAKFISILVGLYFLFSGIQTFIHYYKHSHKIQVEQENVRYIDIFAPKQSLGIVSSNTDVKYFISLRDSLRNHHNGKIKIYLADENEINDEVIFVQESVWLENKEKYARKHKVIIQKDYDISTAINHLKNHVFKVSKPLEWKFQNN